MAYTGTTPQVWVRLCETAPVEPSTSATDCAWVQIYRSVLDIPAFDLSQLNELIEIGALLFVLIFIVSMAKKAIEQ